MAELVAVAFNIVANSGEPDAWIQAVADARKEGVVGPAVSCFLVWQFARIAAVRLQLNDPAVSALCARINDIEGELGFEERDFFNNEPVLPETGELWEEWTSQRDQQVMEILLRNEERDVASDYEAGDRTAVRHTRGVAISTCVDRDICAARAWWTSTARTASTIVRSIALTNKSSRTH